VVRCYEVSFISETLPCLTACSDNVGRYSCTNKGATWRGKWLPPELPSHKSQLFL